MHCIHAFVIELCYLHKTLKFISKCKRKSCFAMLVILDTIKQDPCEKDKNKVLLTAGKGNEIKSNWAS